MTDAAPAAPNEAVIRPYDGSDEKFIKFTIGKAVLDGLAVANGAGESPNVIAWSAR
jgi:hypothetical protein